MGNIKKVIGNVPLGKNKFEPAEEKWCLPFNIELKENVHIHWQDVRIEMRIRDFGEFVMSLANAYNRWMKIGKPATLDKVKYLGGWLGEEEYSFDSDRDIEYTKNLRQRHHFRVFPRTEKGKLKDDNAFQLELQQNGQYHLHYKNFRIEIGKTNLKKMAEVIKKVLE